MGTSWQPYPIVPKDDATGIDESRHSKPYPFRHTIVFHCKAAATGCNQIGKANTWARRRCTTLSHISTFAEQFPGHVIDNPLIPAAWHFDASDGVAGVILWNHYAGCNGIAVLVGADFDNLKAERVFLAVGAVLALGKFPESPVSVAGNFDDGIEGSSKA